MNSEKKRRTQMPRTPLLTKPLGIGQKPSLQSLLVWWGDLVTLASIGICVWFLAQMAYQLWR